MLLFVNYTNLKENNLMISVWNIVKLNLKGTKLEQIEAFFILSLACFSFSFIHCITTILLLKYVTCIIFIVGHMAEYNHYIFVLPFLK